MSPLVKGLLCRCPECGKGGLYRGALSLKKECPACQLSYDFADAGDGPAVFIIFIVGFVVVTGALLTEVYYQPPYWVHAALWLPATIVLSLVLLRPLKATLISIQHHHKARQGKQA